MLSHLEIFRSRKGTVDVQIQSCLLLRVAVAGLRIQPVTQPLYTATILEMVQVICSHVTNTIGFNM